MALPGRPQQLQHPGGQRHAAVFPAFALAHPHALRIDVRDLSRRPFPQAQPAGVDQPHTHPGFRALDQGQQGPDFPRTQHDRQFLDVPGANQVEDWPRPLQRALVEEPDPREVNAEGALGDLLLIEQEQEILAQLLFAELVGSALVVLSQSVDSGDITRLGLGGEPPQLQVFEHAVSEGGHGNPPVHVEHRRFQKVETHRKISHSSA